MDALKRFFDAAFYTRNTPGWERVLRFALAAGLVVWALRPGVHLLMASFLVGNAVFLLATVSTGFCPACYFAGRRILSRRGSQP
jgi:hypothetical protein